MAGFPSFFENCSRISSSSRQTLVQSEVDDSKANETATPAKAATNSPIEINKVFVAGVAASNRQKDLGNKVSPDKYLAAATAKPATPILPTVAGVADVATPDLPSQEPVYMLGEERPVLTRDQMLAIPIRNCLDCFRFQVAGAYCKFYGHLMSDPTRPCRCRHFRRRGTVH